MKVNSRGCGMKIYKEDNVVYVDGEGEAFNISEAMINFEAADDCFLTISNCVFNMNYSEFEAEVEKRLEEAVQIRIKEIKKERSDTKSFIKESISERFKLLDFD